MSESFNTLACWILITELKECTKLLIHFVSLLLALKDNRRNFSKSYIRTTAATGTDFSLTQEPSFIVEIKQAAQNNATHGF